MRSGASHREDHWGRAVTTTLEPQGGAGAGQKGLKGGALGLLSSTVIGISSVAPAYSLASALGFVVLDVGVRSPAVMLLAFVPMLLVAFAYQQLNKEMPDCGSTFTWSTKAFGPRTGWMGGWGILAADIIVMANLGAIAGQYMFLLVGANGLAASTLWSTVGGVAWIVVMTAICYCGIEISAMIQYGLLIIEVVMLAVFSVVALVKSGNNTAPAGHLHPSLSWFNPLGVHSFSALTAGLLTAIFIYWGWDTALSLNEETKDKGKVPGQAAVISTLILLATYLLVSTAATAFAGVGTKGIGLGNANNSGDVLSVLGTAVFGAHGFGHVLAKLLVLMVLSSSAASTLTTIMPTARTSLSMAAYRAIPDRFATMQRRFLTPSWSTIGMGIVSIVFYVVMEKLSTNVLTDTIDAIGLMIAFYYGMTGFACAWWFRRDLRNSTKDLFLKGIFPFLGGLILLLFFVKGVSYDWTTASSYSVWHMPFPPHWHIGGAFLTGVGALLLGVVLMEIYRHISPAFFRGETLNRDTPILVPELDNRELATVLGQESVLDEDPLPPIGSVSPNEEEIP
jgi:amino acid transporter